jgi:hypothetical protein
MINSNNRYQQLVQLSSKDTKTEEQFCRYFNVTHLRSRSSPKQYMDYNTYANGQINYYNYSDRDETLEIEMPKRSWEELMRYYRTSEKVADLENYEHNMRLKYPAVKDAHEKYLMLMELYR